MFNYFRTAPRRFVLLLCFLTSLFLANYAFADRKYSLASDQGRYRKPTMVYQQEIVKQLNQEEYLADEDDFEFI